MSLKKIAFIVTIPEMAYNFLWDHIVKLQEEYEVHLIANFQNKFIENRFRDIGVICHQEDIQRGISIYKDLKSIFSFAKLYRKEKFVSVHSVAPKAGLVNTIAGWISRIPIRIHIFTGQVWATKTGASRIILKIIDKIIVRFSTDILVDGRSQQRFLIEERIINDSNSKVLAKGSICGVSLERFTANREIRQAERYKIKATEDDIVFVFMGRLNHDKGIGELFAAFNKLTSKYQNTKLVLFGHDENQYDKKSEEFENIVKGVNYFYPGRTERPYESLQAGDVFVLPSWREGFGSSVIEASCLGLAVITTNVYGLKDASIENVTGLRCNVNDTESLYFCMKKYCDDPSLINKHGTNGHQYVIENFDNKDVTQAWIEYYHNLFANFSN